jgi:hypothetical protein
VRHDRLKAETAFSFDACVALAIGDALRLFYALVVRAKEFTSDVIGIDVLAEVFAPLAKKAG